MLTPGRTGKTAGDFNMNQDMVSPRMKLLWFSRVRTIYVAC